jgi:phosphohistidine phosphatase SixA
LTAKGKSQCLALQATFKHHNDIDLVLASPLRRTVQTASLSFGPVLAKKEVPFVLLPMLQEVSNMYAFTIVKLRGHELGLIFRYIGAVILARRRMN